jgi:hypothetical protein
MFWQFEGVLLKMIALLQVHHCGSIWFGGEPVDPARHTLGNKKQNGRLQCLSCQVNMNDLSTLLEVNNGITRHEPYSRKITKYGL